MSTVLGFASELFNWFFGITISIYLILDQKKVFYSIERFFRAYFPIYEKRILYFFKFTYRTFQDYMIGRILDSFVIDLIACIGLINKVIAIGNIAPIIGPKYGIILVIKIINANNATYGVFKK